MLAVPVSAAVTPAPDPVDAVCTVTLGQSLAICWTHRLNSGKSRLEPVSCSDTAVVGQFSRLESDTADVVDGDVEGEELGGAFDEPQAAARRATPASTITDRAARRRPR